MVFIVGKKGEQKGHCKQESIATISSPPTFIEDAGMGAMVIYRARPVCSL
jgi:hypothetical protein